MINKSDICKVFLDFIREENVFPEDIAATFYDKKYSEYNNDVRRICDILISRADYKPSDIEKELKYQNRRPNQQFDVDLYEKKDSWNKETYDQDMLEWISTYTCDLKAIDACLDNNAHKDHIATGIPVLIAAVEEFISTAPETLQKNEYIEKINEIRKPSQKIIEEPSKEIISGSDWSQLFDRMRIKTTNSRPPKKNEHWPFKKNKQGVSNFCRSKGVPIPKEFTLAAICGQLKHGGVEGYWANVYPDATEREWVIVCNDYHKKILYILKVPAGKFKDYTFDHRGDNGKIDLYITLNDLTDYKSQNNFTEFKCSEIPYTDEDIAKYDR